MFVWFNGKNIEQMKDVKIGTVMIIFLEIGNATFLLKIPNRLQC